MTKIQVENVDNLGIVIPKTFFNWDVAITNADPVENPLNTGSARKLAIYKNSKYLQNIEKKQINRMSKNCEEHSKPL